MRMRTGFTSNCIPRYFTHIIYYDKQLNLNLNILHIYIHSRLSTIRFNVAERQVVKQKWPGFCKCVTIKAYGFLFECPEIMQRTLEDGGHVFLTAMRLFIWPTDVLSFSSVLKPASGWRSLRTELFLTTENLKPSFPFYLLYRTETLFK